MTLDEYERFGQKIYADLAKFIAATLADALEPLRGEIQLQHVTTRPKGLLSLREKLQNNEVAADETHIEEKIKDLTGCRLVFYTNTDVDLFLRRGVIRDLFEIDWKRSKSHYPTEESDSEFRSDNLVVRLKESHISIPDCERFRGLACEIQVQTALNHAWSEMEHEIYKNKTPAAKGYGKARMDAVKERMRNIMRKYLLPAGYEFQKIRDDLAHLTAGKELFDKDALKVMASATNNNERVELLERFSTNVLSDLDDVTSSQAEIRKTVAVIIRASRTTPTQPVETTFGSFHGMTADDVLDKGMDIVDQIRYTAPDAVQNTFDLQCELYRDATSDEQRKRLLQSAEHLAESEITVWDKAGPIVQHILAERIDGLDLKQAEPIRPVLLKVLSELLKSEVTGTSSTYKTFTWSTRAANPSDALATIRARAIEALKRLFRSSNNDRERSEVFHTLDEATRTPHRGGYPDALLHLILNNTLEIVEFYTAEAPGLSFELLQKIENNLLFQYRRTRDMPADAERDAGVREVKERLSPAILRFRDAINKDRAFATYKVLVGHESIFPPAWKDENFHYEGSDAYRKQEIDKFVEGIDKANADQWFSVIKRCVGTKSDDGATFIYFGPFLERLGAQKPEIALKYLDAAHGELASIIPGLVKGLETSAADEVGKRLARWIERKENLADVLWYYRFSPTATVDAVKSATTAAIQTKNERAVAHAVEVATARYKDLGADLIEGVLLPGIEWLAANGYAHVFSGLLFIHGKESPFRHLTVEQARRVLNLIVARGSIETRIDYLLGAIGSAHPEAVVDFLTARVRHERDLKADSDVSHRYEAIPFQFHGANEALKKAPDYLLKAMRQWYEEDDSLFSLRGGRLAHSVYQKVKPELIASLQAYIGAGKAKDLAFVVEVLERFEGAEEAQPVYKSIVAKLPKDDPLLRAVSVGLNGTGVVMGEFGMADAYKARRTSIAQWLEDPDEKVRHFAGEQVKLLEQMIKSEQRRAEGDLERRKREWGTGEGAGDPT